jgi:hypothetical protein
MGGSRDDTGLTGGQHEKRPRFTAAGRGRPRIPDRLGSPGQEAAMVVSLCQAHRWSPPGGARAGHGPSFSPVQAGARPGIPSLSPVALASALFAFPASR